MRKLSSHRQTRRQGEISAVFVFRKVNSYNLLVDIIRLNDYNVSTGIMEGCYV